MKNYKKLFAVLLAVTLLLSLYIPAAVSSATYYSAEATYLNGLGLYYGINTSFFDPALDMLVTKQEAVAVIVRAFGGKAYALALNDRDIERQLVNYGDSDQIDDWARPYFAAGLGLGLINGDTNLMLNPKLALDAKMMAKLILTNAEYAVDVAGYQTGVWKLRDMGVYTTEQAAVFMDRAQLTRDDLCGMLYYGLATTIRTQGRTIIGYLVDTGYTTEFLALSKGRIYEKEFMLRLTKAITDYETLPVTTAAELATVNAIKALWYPPIGPPGAARGKIYDDNVYDPYILTIDGPLKTAVLAIQARFDARALALTTLGASLVSGTANPNSVVLTYSRAIASGVTTGITIKAGPAGTNIPVTGYTASADGKTITIYYGTTFSPLQLGTAVTVTSTTTLGSIVGPVVANTTTLYVTDTVAPGAYFNLVTDNMFYAKAYFNKPLDPTTVATGFRLYYYGVEIGIGTNYFLTNNNQVVNFYYGDLVAPITVGIPIVLTTTATLKTADAALTGVLTESNAVTDITAPYFTNLAGTGPSITGTAAHFFLMPSETLSLGTISSTVPQDLTGTGTTYMRVTVDGVVLNATVLQTNSSGMIAINPTVPLTLAAHTIEISAYHDVVGFVGPTTTIVFTPAS